MNIILSGYGKMGKVVEKVALSRGHRVLAIIDKPDDRENIPTQITENTVAVDFSLPSEVVDNIRFFFDKDIPVVVGTTGWNDHIPKVRHWVEQEGKALFFSTNFSIGMNLMFELTKTLSNLLNHIENFELVIEETHHIHKLDAPSGTAIKLAEIILENFKSKTRWVNRTATSPEELQVISHREGEVAGIHSLICTSDSDRLTLTHEARDRSGLALGAVMAAEWIYGKKGFFEMKDMLSIRTESLNKN